METKSSADKAVCVNVDFLFWLFGEEVGLLNMLLEL